MPKGKSGRKAKGRNILRAKGKGSKFLRKKRKSK